MRGGWIRRTGLAIGVAMSVSALVGSVGLQGSASAGPVATGWGCANTQVVAVPGTWETSPSNNPRTPVGLLKELTNNLDNRSASINYIPYTARMLDTHTMIDSWNAGFQETNRAIATLAEQCPRSDFVIIGFSQGAGIAGDVLTNIGQGTGPIDAKKVTRGALYSDPLRSPGAPTPPVTDDRGAAPGGGVLGVRSIPDFGDLKSRVFSFCTPGDPICSIDQRGTIIPNLAVHLTNVSLSDPASIIAAIQGALTTVGMDNLAETFTSVVAGQTDPLAALSDLPSAILGDFTNIGTGLQVPTDMDVQGALEGAAEGDINKVAAALGGDPEAWGVIGQQGVPLISYLFKGVPDRNDFVLRAASSLAQLAAYADGPARHGYYAVQPIGPQKVPAVKWAADWINPTLTGKGLLSQ